MFVILLLFFFHFFYFFIYLFISAVEYTVQCNPCWICVVELCSVATRVEVLSIFCTMLLELYQIRKLHVFQHKNCFCCHFCLLYENEAVKPPQICRSLSFVVVFFPFHVLVFFPSPLIWLRMPHITIWKFSSITSCQITSSPNDYEEKWIHINLKRFTFCLPFFLDIIICNDTR